MTVESFKMFRSFNTTASVYVLRTTSSAVIVSIYIFDMCYMSNSESDL